MVKKIKIVMAAIFLVFFISLLLFFCLWYLNFENAFFNKSLSDKEELLVIDSTAGYCIAGVIFFIPAILFFPVSSYFRIKNKDDHKLMNLVNKVMVSFCLVALAFLFLGPLTLTQYWETKAEEAGYTRCPSMTLLINRIHYTAWMQDIYYCDDPSVARILGRGSHQEVEEVNQYIRRRNRK